MKKDVLFTTLVYLSIAADGYFVLKLALISNIAKPIGVQGVCKMYIIRYRILGSARTMISSENMFFIYA
jgi:hypothetical protein